MGEAGCRVFAAWALEGEGGIWTLSEGGAIVSVWREVDAPGLSTWLALRLTEWRGATHVAAPKLSQIERNRKNAAAGGKKNAKKTRPRLERAMRAALQEKKKNPLDYFEEWQSEYGYTRQQLKNILAAVRVKKTSTA